MKKELKSRLIEMMKEVKFPAFPGGGLDVSVGNQLPDHAFEAIAEHLVANGITQLSHIKRYDVEHQIGPYVMDEVVLFNINQISQKEAHNYVAAGQYNDNVLVLPKKQWISLFRDGREDEEKEE